MHNEKQNVTVQLTSSYGKLRLERLNHCCQWTPVLDTGTAN